MVYGWSSGQLRTIDHRTARGGNRRNAADPSRRLVDELLSDSLGEMVLLLLDVERVCMDMCFLEET